MAGSDAKTPAPKKDQVHGSKTNPKGSASSGKSKAVKFSARTEKTLSEKVKNHNEKASEGRKATLGMLKAVYRRGAGAFSKSHRPGMTRDQWAMGRVNAFLRLLKSGRPDNAKYVTDNDLLPAKHPKSTKKKSASVSGITASAEIEELDSFEDFLIVTLKNEEEYSSPEEAILALTEYLGLGYEAEPAIRAAWIRGVNAGESPYQRALSVAEYSFESNDADLLPKPEKGVL